MSDKKFGFKDTRTAAELALSAYKPKSRSVAAASSLRTQGGRFGKALGTVSTATSLNSAMFSQIKASVAARQQLTRLSSSLKTSLRGFDGVANDLLSGTTSIKDVDVFGLNSTTAVKSGEFFSAEDLVQSSALTAGASLSNSTTFRAQLADRKRQLTKIYTRISTQLGNFSLTGSLVSENYDRKNYPLPEDIDTPSIPRLAQGDEAAAADNILKDKRQFVVQGVATAISAPTFWTRLTGTAENPLRAFKSLLGYNRKLNMTFKDEKSNQKGWSEPASPYAAQFPYNKVQQTESGHVLEFDDTPGAERVHVFHRSGSFIEMHPDGKVVYKSMNHGYLISMADQYVKVRGSCHISVDGDTTIYSRGNLNLQSDSDINVNTTKDFNVYATNVNLRAKKDARLTGRTVDLQYAKLPGKPVFTTNGPAVRLVPSAIKKDFPDIAKQIEDTQQAYNASLNGIQLSILKKMGTTLASDALLSGAFGLATVATTSKMAATIYSGSSDTIKLIKLLRQGPYASIADIPSYKYPTLTPDETPKENPLGNPLIYNSDSAEAVAYRGQLFDTPEELRDAEMYQAHLDTRKLLNDVPSTLMPEIAGHRRIYDTGLHVSTSLPIPDLLDRESFRGKYAFTPSTRLANTSFTVKDLVDSLAFPTVANYIPTVEELADLQDI